MSTRRIDHPPCDARNEAEGDRLVLSPAEKTQRGQQIVVSQLGIVPFSISPVAMMPIVIIVSVMPVIVGIIVVLVPPLVIVK